MKKLHLAIMVAMLISGLFFSQASAAPSPSVSASGSCGSTYTVLAGDTLSSIAAKCGVTVAGILSNNPSITNPNLIYRGQVLNLAGITTTTTTVVTGGNCSNPYTVVGGDYLASIAARCGTTVADILYNNPSITNANLIYVGQVLKLTASSTTTTPGTTYSGDAYITISATSADPGDTIVVKAYNFPKNASVDFRVFKKGSSTYTDVYDSTTDSSGYAKKTVTIPSSAATGQYYVVKVMTTDRVDGVTITSPSILITSGGGGGSSDASVTLSKYSVTPGGTLEVFANDFPANQDIDFCVRKSGSSTCAVVYDGKTDGDGYDSTTVTFPSSAVAGQTWVVQVKTTNLVSEVKAVSPKVTIK